MAALAVVVLVCAIAVPRMMTDAGGDTPSGTTLSSAFSGGEGASGGATSNQGSGSQETQQSEEDASKSSLEAYGAASSLGAYDIFYSTSQGGICRGDRSNGTVELLYPIDSERYWVNRLAVEGDLIYYTFEDYMDSETRPELHAVGLDGTGDRIIFSGVSAADGAITVSGHLDSIDQISVSDGVLNLVCTYTQGDAYDSEVRIFRMNADGTDIVTRGVIGGIRGDGVLATENAAYYVNHGIEPAEVATLDFATNRTFGLYPGGVWGIADLVLADGRLYCREYDENGLNQRITSFATDGTDVRTVYEFPANSSGMILAAQDRGLFCEVYSRDENPVDVTTWDLVRISCEDGSAQTIMQDIDLYNPAAYNMGDHLLLLENGQYMGSMGVRGISVGFDGSDAVEYGSE